MEKEKTNKPLMAIVTIGLYFKTQCCIKGKQVYSIQLVFSLFVLVPNDYYGRFSCY